MTFYKVSISMNDSKSGVRSHLKEDLQYTTGLLVDQARDTLNTAEHQVNTRQRLVDIDNSPSSRQSSDSRLGNALDVVTKNLAMTLGSALSESLAAFAASSHCDRSVEKGEKG